MSSSEFPDGSPYARGSRDSRGRGVSRAVADRERGRRRLNATTATVGFASVVAAGAVAVALPGSTHAAASNTHKDSSSTGTAASGSSSTGATKSGTASSGATNKHSSSSGSGSSGTSSGSSNTSDSSSSSSTSNSSGNLQAPASTPIQSSGGGQVTSGGS